MTRTRFLAIINHGLRTPLHLHTGFDDHAAHRLAGPREVQELVAGTRKRSLRGIWEDGRPTSHSSGAPEGFNGPAPHLIHRGVPRGLVEPAGARCPTGGIWRTICTSGPKRTPDPRRTHRSAERDPPWPSRPCSNREPGAIPGKPARHQPARVPVSTATENRTLLVIENRTHWGPPRGGSAATGAGRAWRR